MKKKFGLFLLLGVILFLLIPISNPLFDTPYSTVLEDRNGELLSAKIAADGQWRFPEGDSIPDKFATSIRFFEDEYFYYHLGVNPVSIIRAIQQNIKAKTIISGGSTISMQLARLARKNKPRTIWNKLVELLWALKIEFSYSKDEIINLYAAHAPFGGNVVGLDAAAWRYFGRSPDRLSWSESAALAVLPNAPSLIRPGKNQKALLEKRNRLLKKLKDKEIIDQITYELALLEDLPLHPNPLPREAVHLLNRSMAEGKQGKRLITTLKKNLQIQVNQVVDHNYRQLVQNEVHNLAVLLIDNRKNEVLAYVGNSNPNAGNNGHQVDVIMANRSTGSLLKPFLYGLAWQEGLVLPTTILADIPTQFGGYAPKNFNKKYDGACKASEALIRSLNVPAVRLLQEYKLERFYDELEHFPFDGINRGVDHYGLSIILGGAESSLWELCTAYKGMSESLTNIQERDYKYSFSDYDFPDWQMNGEKKEKKLSPNTPLKASAIWQLVESLKEVNRPGQERGWESYAGRRKLAWKTGTSFGLRDAWAIGISPDYTIGVWVGNADGEGRPELTGIQAAAPILFELVDLLPEGKWYDAPYDELHSVIVCAESGYGKGVHCLKTDTLLTGRKGQEIKTCPYHKLVQLTKDGTKQVNSSCYAVADMKTESYLVLPPLMEYYYQQSNPNYRKLPVWEKGCQQLESLPMELISPENAEKILIPVELNGEKGSLVVELAHRNNAAIINWYLDDQFIGTTEGIHQQEINPDKGKHILTLIDEEGNSLIKEIEVIN